jgi:DNA-binding transcriptional LysR family regulator
MFDWSDARIFLAVCGRLSLTAAAKDLAIDQTTVGRRIAALEAALDAKLFTRGPTGLTLTSAGEEARSLAEQMEATAGELDRRLRGRDRAAEGYVRITTAESLARAFLAPRLAGFRRTHPGIELSVKTDNRVLSLTRGEADMALRHWRPTQPGLVARKIARVSFALYASSAYVAEGRSEADDVFLGFEDELATMPDAEWLSERSSSRYAMRTNSRGVLESAAAGGLGIAVLPCYLGDAHADLTRVGGSEPPLVRDLWLVVHAELRAQARVRAVVDFIVDEARKARDVLLGRPNPRAAHRARAVKGRDARRSPV